MSNPPVFPDDVSPRKATSNPKTVGAERSSSYAEQLEASPISQLINDDDISFEVGLSSTWVCGMSNPPVFPDDVPPRKATSVALSSSAESLTREQHRNPKTVGVDNYESSVPRWTESSSSHLVQVPSKKTSSRSLESSASFVLISDETEIMEEVSPSPIEEVLFSYEDKKSSSPELLSIDEKKTITVKQEDILKLFEVNILKHNGAVTKRVINAFIDLLDADMMKELMKALISDTRNIRTHPEECLWVFNRAFLSHQGIAKSVFCVRNLGRVLSSLPSLAPSLKLVTGIFQGSLLFGSEGGAKPGEIITLLLQNLANRYERKTSTKLCDTRIQSWRKHFRYSNEFADMVNVSYFAFDVDFQQVPEAILGFVVKLWRELPGGTSTIEPKVMAREHLPSYLFEAFAQSGTPLTFAYLLDELELYSPVPSSADWLIPRWLNLIVNGSLSLAPNSLINEITEIFPNGDALDKALNRWLYGKTSAELQKCWICLISLDRNGAYHRPFRMVTVSFFDVVTYPGGKMDVERLTLFWELVVKKADTALTAPDAVGLMKELLWGVGTDVGPDSVSRQLRVLWSSNQVKLRPLVARLRDLGQSPLIAQTVSFLTKLSAAWTGNPTLIGDPNRQGLLFHCSVILRSFVMVQSTECKYETLSKTITLAKNSKNSDPSDIIVNPFSSGCLAGVASKFLPQKETLRRVVQLQEIFRSNEDIKDVGSRFFTPPTVDGGVLVTPPTVDEEVLETRETLAITGGSDVAINNTVRCWSVNVTESWLVKLGEEGVHVASPLPDSSPFGYKQEGNTCYLNAMLQCLQLNVNFLTNLFRFDPRKKKDADKFAIIALQQVMGRHVAAQTAEWLSKRELPPRYCDELNTLSKTLKRHFSSKNRESYATSTEPLRATLPPDFQTGRQQDSSEFGRLLFSALGGVENDLICAVFGGQEQNVVSCPECGKSSKTITHFVDMTLTVPVESDTSSVQDLIDSVFVPENPEGYRCSGCRETVTAIKTKNIPSPPAHLSLVLNRFTWSLSSNDKRKIFSRVQTNKIVTLPGGHTYEFFAAVLHDGPTADSGHYIAVGKRTECEKGARSFLFDDAKVREIREAGSWLDRKSAKASKRRRGSSNLTPYVLFYRNVSLQGLGSPDLHLPARWLKVGEA